ncbi:hypothetical protein [Priestia filamentosa]|uniref:hypothetical protein n=1 Tax=Priestia filamentosa TaxID=1402861 RepID=UPI00111C90A4|nr:hypothetical protein [Priestia filamentosa]
MMIDIINVRKKSKNALGFLNRLEKMALGHRIKNQNDKFIFGKYIKSNLSTEEVKVMITEIELNQNKWTEYLKLLFSFGVAFITVICSFFAVLSIAQYNFDLQLALKSAEQGGGFQLIGIHKFYNTLKDMWLILSFIIIGISYISFILLPKRRILFLSILKSIEK